MSEDNADKSAAAVVYDTLDSFLELHARVRRHSVELVVESLVHKFMEGFAEYVAFPDLLGILFKVRQQVGDELLGLLLTADYRIDLGSYIRGHHVN